MSPTKKAEQPKPIPFEVLTQAANGHRTVHRLYAVDQAAAEAEIAALLDPLSEVLESAPVRSDPDGEGLGSG